MAGIANSWIDQYTVQPTPCILDTSTNTGTSATSNTLSNCLFWLVAGLLIGSITFKKKGS